MPAAGLLLTGGASRRMGASKALVDRDGVTLAERTGQLLSLVTHPALEVGPGWSGLPKIADVHPGAGPLAATSNGIAELAARGWSGPVVVVATDLPRLTPGFLRWLGDHPARCSVVPLYRGRSQPLCARYSAPDCASAVQCATAGARSMGALLDAIDALFVGPHLWESPAGDRDAIADVDTPADLDRLMPAPGGMLEA